jgi:hypothetical protein
MLAMAGKSEQEAFKWVDSGAVASVVELAPVRHCCYCGIGCVPCRDVACRLWQLFKGTSHGSHVTFASLRICGPRVRRTRADSGAVASVVGRAPGARHSRCHVILFNTLLHA